MCCYKNVHMCIYNSGIDFWQDDLVDVICEFLGHDAEC